MNLLAVVFTIVIVGIILGLILKYGESKLGMPAIMVTIILWLVVGVTILWVLQVVGLLDYARGISMPTLK